MFDEKIFFIALVASILILQVSIAKAELTEKDLQAILANQTELDSIKDKINSAFNSFPPSLKNAAFGTDRTYYVKIGDSDIGMEFKNGEVTKIWPGVPDSPTYVVNTNYDTILEISNSKNPLTTASNIISDKEIKIEASSNSSNPSKSPSLSMWIISIVGFIVVVVIIILIVRVVKRKPSEGSTENQTSESLTASFSSFQ